MNSQAAIVGFHPSNLFTWHQIQKRSAKVDLIQLKKFETILLGKGSCTVFECVSRFRENPIVSKLKQDSCYKVYASLYI